MPTHLPLVSVVTVCRNAANHIEETLRSVLALRYPALEQIVVDGCSTDSTLDIVQDLAPLFAQKGIALRVLSETDAGIYDAMNKGANMATGLWICYMNAGDCFAQPNVLREMLAPAVSDNCGVIYGQIALRKSFGDVVMRPKPIDYLRKKMAFCHQAALVRSQLMRRYPFDLQYRVAADYDWFHRYWRQGGIFVYRDVVVARFEAEGGVSSTQRLLKNREYAHIRGIDQSLNWRLRYAWKACALHLKSWWRQLLPKRWSEAMREANYRRLQRRRSTSSPT